MRGNGRGRTAIVWSLSSIDNKASATFTVEAKHFVAFGISFKVMNKEQASIFKTQNLTSNCFKFYYLFRLAE